MTARTGNIVVVGAETASGRGIKEIFGFSFAPPVFLTPSPRLPSFQLFERGVVFPGKMADRWGWDWGLGEGVDGRPCWKRAAVSGVLRSGGRVRDQKVKSV